ncbi:hypothetical protein ES703_110748 [subsurface metagenome]
MKMDIAIFLLFGSPDIRRDFPLTSHLNKKLMKQFRLYYLVGVNLGTGKCKGDKIETKSKVFTVSCIR